MIMDELGNAGIRNDGALPALLPQTSGQYGPASGAAGTGSAEAILNALLGSSEAAIIVTDPNGIVKLWSSSAEKMFGYTEAEMMDHSLTVLVPADLQEEERSVTSLLKQNEKTISMQTQRMTREKEIIEVSLTLSAVRHSSGEITGAVIMMKNITALKIAEEKGSILSAIIASTDDAIISKNLNSIVTSWNGSAQRIFGYTADEMIGQSILKLIPPDRQEEEPLILSRLSRGERVDHFETKRVTKYRALLDVSITISPIKDSQGKLIGLSKIARDITEKKQEEQRKNDFIAIVSHELKTPLTSMRSYIQLVLARAKRNDDGFAVNALTRAELQTKKMSTMIHDFLNLSRLEDGKMQLNLSSFTLSALMEEIVSDGIMLSPHHIIDYQGCQEINVLADRDKIGQVMNNLLSNAVKYSPVGSTITITCMAQQGKVCISFRDQGIGIAPDDQRRLFEKFYRVSNEKIRNVSGFGIGLYLVAEILRLHHTEISVQSALEQGTTFSFLLTAEN